MGSIDRTRDWAGRGLLAGALLAMLAGCGGDSVGPGSGQGADPVVVDYPIVYVQRRLPRDNQNRLDEDNISRPLAFNAGGDLYIKPRAALGAAARNLTAAITGGAGDVRDPSVSHDGQRVVFALRLPEIDGADDADQPTWNIWEYDLAADSLRRVIGPDIIAEGGQDLAPAYLPDGRIVFSSTRQQRVASNLLDEGRPAFSAQEESLRDPALVLHVMGADGQDIRQISFNQSHDLDPAVLDDGRIVFSRWEHMSGRNAIHLYSMAPDGRDLQLLYGRNSHASGSDGDTVQFVQPQPVDGGRLLSLLRPFTGSDFGGMPVLLDVQGFVDRDRTLGGLAGEAQQPATVLPVRTAPGLSPGGRYASAYPLNDGTPRLLVSWTPCLVEDAIGSLPCEAGEADAVAADPVYGLWVYDPADATQKPVALPPAGAMISQAVSVNPRDRPALTVGTGCDVLIPDCEAENVGLIDIRSVYDMDGQDTSPGGIAVVSDPARTAVSQRPARYLRLLKPASIPGDEVYDFDNSAFGVNRGQLMREILGYLPIEPDGSVLGKVPAQVAFSIDVVDANGRRISQRHRNWLQVQPGERLVCNGCHQAASQVAHGRRDALPEPVNPGALQDGLAFPNTDPALFADAGETMAQTRARHSCFTDCAALQPSLDLRFSDVWAAQNPAADEQALFAELQTPAPAEPSCQSAWHSGCRVVINYAEHIQPLWERLRQTFDADGLTLLDDRTCVACHSSRDAADNARVPDAQLDLTATPSDRNADHLTAYQELLAPDDLVELVLPEGLLRDVQRQVLDANGDPLFETDADGNQILDANGDPVPVLERVRAPGPVMSVNGALASRFFQAFDAGGSHAGDLDVAELKLLAEWLDMGAQYFNNPFAAPEN